MLRLIYRHDLTAEGASETEAERAAATLEAIAGLTVLSERTIADPRQTLAALGTSVEEARAEVQRLSPAGAQVIADKVLCAADRGEFLVDAKDEQSAIAEAMERFGSPATVAIRTSVDGPPAEVPLVEVESTTIWKAGRRGFLGFGAEPARYDVVLNRKACVERTYFLGWRFIRTVGVEVKCVETLQRCARSDNLDRDRDLDLGTSELIAEGAVGSLALAKLIDACRESYSAAILWPLHAAREAEPTRALIEALEAALKADQQGSFESGGNWLAPELAGERNIGWSDTTFRQLRSLAGESLDVLKQKTPTGDAVSLPGSVEIVCARCIEPPLHRIEDELLCGAHYRQG